MLFSSVTFLLYFLPIFLVAYTLLPYRNTTLLLFSAVFYLWGEGVFLLVLVFSVIINFIAGAYLSSKNDKIRNTALFVGVSANLLLLMYFKYIGFFIFEILKLEHFNPANIPHLPLGISFFTFQSLSYLIDIYLKRASPAKSIWDLALYIMMFPQLIAGPIVRYASIEKAIHQRKTTHIGSSNGIYIFAIGLGQKVLIANNVASVADTIFQIPVDSLNTMLAWLGAITYSLQIYFDFSGYSNMAIGLGIIIGFRFPVNFNYPYISQSISEFWRRWHISLSAWFRDYLYIPLGGNRRGSVKTYRNLIIVFLICGLWHGAAWTFIIWGIYHGTLIIIERIGLSNILSGVPRYLSHTYTLVAIVVGWVIFRSENLTQALEFLNAMFNIKYDADSTNSIWEFINHQQLLAMLFGIIASTPLIRNVFKPFIYKERKILNTEPVLLALDIRPIPATIFSAIVIFICVTYIAAGTYNPFIYFRF